MTKNKLKFYSISEDYIKYLKQFDSKIPDVTYASREKFFVGVVLEKNGCKYYAPVSSYKIKQESDYVIKIHKKPSSSIRFNFMIPVPDSEVKLMDFTKDNLKYQKLVKIEFAVISRYTDYILKIPEKVYALRCKGVKRYETHCCDFKLLEEKCKEYIKEHNKESRKEEEKEEEEMEK